MAPVPASTWLNCIEVIYMQDEYCICILICPSQKQPCRYQVSVSGRFTLATLLNSFDAVLNNSIAFIYFQSFVNSGHDKHIESNDSFSPDHVICLCLIRSACSPILGDILWPSGPYSVDPPPHPGPCLQFSRLQDPDTLKSAGLLPLQNDCCYRRPL